MVTMFSNLGFILNADIVAKATVLIALTNFNYNQWVNSNKIKK